MRLFNKRRATISVFFCLLLVLDALQRKGFERLTAAFWLYCGISFRMDL